MDKRFVVICMAYKIAGASIILILHVAVGWCSVRGGRSDVDRDVARSRLGALAAQKQQLLV